MNTLSQPCDVESRIELLFGDKIIVQKTPIYIDLTFDVFSQKNENLRFNIQQMLSIQIKENTLLIELTAIKGYGADLADKIMDFLKSNNSYLELMNEKKLLIKAIGKGEICYLFVQSQKFSQQLDKISKECENLKQNNQKSTHQNTNHSINLQVKSNNTCQYIRNLLDNQGAIRAVFDSLLINFTFRKTALIQKILENLFTEMKLLTVLGPLRSFGNMDLAVKFAGSADLDRYEKLRTFGKVINKIETLFFAPIKGEFKNQIKLHYFSKVFSFGGEVIAEDVDIFLQGLFSEAGTSK